MTRQALNALLCAVITTLDEVPGGWSPRTVIMLGLKLDLPQFTFLEDIMVRGGLVDKTSETLTITDKGRAVAKQVRDHVASKA